MIPFIKSNSNIFIFVFLLFITIDAFLLIIKYRNYLESLPNLKISYNKSKSYYPSFRHNNKYKLAIINLTIENISTKPIHITNIKLICGSKSYLAAPIEITNSYNENVISLINSEETNFFDIDIFSDNILKNTCILSYNISCGYAIFENVEPITDIQNHKLIIETPNKTFEKEIILNPDE